MKDQMLEESKLQFKEETKEIENISNTLRQQVLGSKSFEEAKINLTLMKSLNLLESIQEIQFVNFRCTKTQIDTIQSIASPCKLRIYFINHKELDISKKGPCITLSN